MCQMMTVSSWDVIFLSSEEIHWLGQFSKMKHSEFDKKNKRKWYFAVRVSFFPSFLISFPSDFWGIQSALLEVAGNHNKITRFKHYMQCNGLWTPYQISPVANNTCCQRMPHLVIFLFIPFHFWQNVLHKILTKYMEEYMWNDFKSTRDFYSVGSWTCYVIKYIFCLQASYELHCSALEFYN